MAGTEASQHVYVVKVRTLPDPALLFPSERRYSALTVAGLAAGHALLGAVALLLGVLALSWDPPQGSWFGHLGAGLWLGLAALQAAGSGLLAWRRWYEDRYISWFFRSSLLAAAVAAAGLVLTSAALAHLHENVLSPHHAFTLSPPVTFPGDGAGEAGTAAGSPSWLDLSDSNSSTISSGGVFSDLVRDQDQHRDEDLLAADSTRHEAVEALLESGPDGQGDHATGDGDKEPEWSVLRWVPLSPRASAQIRSLVAVNVLVACFLELLWSLLGARVAWRGIKAADLAQATPATAPAVGLGTGLAALAAVAEKVAAAPLRPALDRTLEREAGDGKVDVDAEHCEPRCEPSGKDQAARASLRRERRAEEASLRKQQKDAASLQRRRRAPELPPATIAPLGELSLGQSTMNLEERVARFLDRSEGQDAEDQDHQSMS